MTSERWIRIKHLFQEVLEQPMESRPDYIREVSGEDTTLRLELESLLTSHDAAGEFLSRPPGVAAAEVLAMEDDAPLVGKRLGAYRMLRRVGRGGTGSVYLATRDDAEFQQRVAVKVIRRGMATTDLLQRFRSERQILASIDHPNIARLLGGGSTDDGLPYFVMEYIEGESLHQFCDRNGLSTRERCELFRRVCEAVHVAHQNLVVHRDLKPGNILITADGTPKLLDFGIAKMLNPELSGESHEPTMLELRIMTPEYASPEQIQGKLITTASDIYSLGVLLYELLAGHRPYTLRGRPLHEMEHVVCTSEPPRPSEIVTQTAETVAKDGSVREITPESVARSRSTDVDKLARELAGDLDLIVLKALRKEPGRRYTSVERLSDDIANHLGGRPVAARPDTFGYRAGKFVGRHRVPAAIMATAMLFGLALTTTIWVQSRQVSLERDRAARAAAEATAVSDFLQEMLASADPVVGMGRHVSVIDAVEAAVPRIGASFEGQPGMEGAVRHTVGRTFARLGRFDEAEVQLRLALAMRRQFVGDNDEEIAETLNALGEVRYDRGDLDGAERLYTEALAMRQRAFGLRSEAVAATLDNLGNVYQDRGETDRAEEAYRSALEMRRELLSPDHRDVASSLNNVGTILHDRKQYAEAEEVYRESLAITRRALGDAHPDVSISLNNLAVLFHDQNKFTEAEPVYREALMLARNALGSRHPEVGTSINNLATLLVESGKLDEAGQLLVEALSIARDAWGDDHTQVAAALAQLGKVKLEERNYDEALAHYDRALAIYAHKLPTDHVSVIFARAHLGRVYGGLGRYAEAEASLMIAYETFLAEYGPADEDVLDFAGWLADVYDQAGRAEDAASFRSIAQGHAVTASTEG